MSGPMASRIRLKDLPEGTRFRVCGYYSRGIFLRLCDNGIQTARSEWTGKETVIHLDTYVDPVPVSEEALVSVPAD